MSEAQRALFIINPISGVKHKRLDTFKSRVAALLDSNLYKAELVTTEYGGHATELTKSAYEKGTRVFIVAGGDGTINEVAAVLKNSDATLGIIPEGSGNGLAHHLNIPGKLSDAINVINSGKIISIDTCMANDSFFVSIAGVGFDARVSRQFARTKQRGFFTYARIVFKEYFTYKTRKYNLELDGREMEISAFFICFANSNQFGYNTKIAPQASITDGLIDVCIVSKPPLVKIPLIAHMVFRNKVNRSRYMMSYKASEVKVSRKRGRTVNVDGEPVKMPRDINFKIYPASLKVFVP